MPTMCSVNLINADTDAHIKLHMVLKSPPSKDIDSSMTGVYACYHILLACPSSEISENSCKRLHCS